MVGFELGNIVVDLGNDVVDYGNNRIEVEGEDCSREILVEWMIGRIGGRKIEKEVGLLHGMQLNYATKFESCRF